MQQHIRITMPHQVGVVRYFNSAQPQGAARGRAVRIFTQSDAKFERFVSHARIIACFLRLTQRARQMRKSPRKRDWTPQTPAIAVHRAVPHEGARD